MSRSDRRVSVRTWSSVVAGYDDECDRARGHLDIIRGRIDGKTGD
jgi:hypothetical protein